jgi:uncharacterized membrane protein YoaK (UPF0700 family)
MFTGQNLNHYSPRNAAVWMSLAFQAGIINTGGFLACHRFVTHTTGFGTLFGVELSKGDFFEGLGMLSVPLFFLIGTMISATFVDQKILKHQLPNYPLVFAIMTVLLFLVTVGGKAGYFGTFGEDLSLVRDYALLAILAFSSGLQNATVTSVFGAVVRTTHLTGLTTDLGIGCVRLFTGTYKLAKDNEIKATWMRLAIIGSFVAGSFSAFVYLHNQYLGFAIPTLISFVLFVVSFKQQSKVRAT